GLGLEPAVGVLAREQQGRRLDARLLAGALFHQRRLVAVVLGPADVHARQHARPILALGAAGAGVHLEIGVVAVGLAREQRLHLLPPCLLGKLAQARLAFLDRGRIVFGLAEL